MGGLKEEARSKIKLLMDKYQRLEANNAINSYNEDRIKNEFLEPLFEALGWDMRNIHSDDEVLKEEKAGRGRADYEFRVNGIPKFFLEAKKAKENIIDEEIDREVYKLYGLNEEEIKIVEESMK